MSIKNCSDVSQPRARVEQAKWRDPEDTAAMERDPVTGRAHRRTIAGWRVTDPLTRLPCRPEHIKAANALRTDWEKGSGSANGACNMEKDWTSGGNVDYSQGQLDARRRYENAVQSVGMRASLWLLPVVLGGCTVADVVARVGGNAMSGQGRLMAALDRLAEHYGIGAKVVVNVWEPELVVDVEVKDIPQEQLGRVKK